MEESSSEMADIEGRVEEDELEEGPAESNDDGGEKGPPVKAVGRRE